MEEVERVRDSYKVLRHKCMYFRGCLEHMVAMSKRSSELVSCTLQIPRDVVWNDFLLDHFVDAGERQRVLFDRASALCEEMLCKELDRLSALIVSEMRLMDEEMKMISEKPGMSLEGLRGARNRHLEAWVSGKQDPWLTGLVLRDAVRDVLLKDEEANDMILSKAREFSALLQSRCEDFKDIVSEFMKIQEQVYLDLSNCMSIDADGWSGADCFFDTGPGSPKVFGCKGTDGERMEEKVEASLETLVEGMNSEVSGKKVVISRSPRAVGSSICRVKRGYTSDWLMAYMVVTSTGYVHFLGISPSLDRFKDIKETVDGLRGSRSRGLGSIFDTGRMQRDASDQEVSDLNGRIMSEIEAFLPGLVFSIKLNNSVCEIDGKRGVIHINDRCQSGLASLFGINGVKTRFFTPSGAQEMFSVLRGEDADVYSSDAGDEDLGVGSQGAGELRVTLQEENPWDE